MAVEMVKTALEVQTQVEEQRWPPQGRWTYDDYRRLPDDGWRYRITLQDLRCVRELCGSVQVSHGEVS